MNWTLFFLGVGAVALLAIAVLLVGLLIVALRLVERTRFLNAHVSDIVLVAQTQAQFIGRIARSHEEVAEAAQRAAERKEPVDPIYRGGIFG